MEDLVGIRVVDGVMGKCGFITWGRVFGALRRISGDVCDNERRAVIEQVAHADIDARIYRILIDIDRVYNCGDDTVVYGFAASAKPLERNVAGKRFRRVLLGRVRRSRDAFSERFVDVGLHDGR
jgi:hypothetical protein